MKQIVLVNIFLLENYQIFQKRLFSIEIYMTIYY